MGSGNDLIVKVGIPSLNLALNVNNDNGTPLVSIANEGLVVET
jgi:hypothetical protein